MEWPTCPVRDRELQRVLWESLPKSAREKFQDAALVDQYLEDINVKLQKVGLNLRNVKLQVIGEEPEMVLTVGFAA